MKGDIKIDLTIDQYKYSGGTDESPSLIIKSFGISDEGMYVCKAVNEAGEGTSNQSYLTFIGKLLGHDEHDTFCLKNKSCFYFVDILAL